MRKIALISDHASPLAVPGSIDSGGQNVYVAHIARQLAQLGYAIDIFTRADGSIRSQTVEFAPNVRVILVPAGPQKHVAKENLMPFMEEFGRYVIGFARRQKKPYNLVHANFFMSGMVARQIKKALGIPFVITFHALGKVRRMSQGQADGFPIERIEIERGLMQDASRVLAECAQDKDDMERLYGASSDCIDVIPCGFDPAEFWPTHASARSFLGLDPGEFMVLQLGRMVPRKGVDNVIRSIAILRDQFGIRARLLVVGGNAPKIDEDHSPELARLRALAKDLGLEEQVSFMGQKTRPELRHYYSAANVFVTTPWYEPFGITPVEAMACGIPVVGSAVGGIKSTVVDGRTGYLVPPNDPEAVASRLAHLHDHPEHARLLGKEGLRRAYQQYTWRGVAEQVAASYEAALNSVRMPVPESVLQVRPGRELTWATRALRPNRLGAMRSLEIRPGGR